MGLSRAEREAYFMDAKAGVLGHRPQLADGIDVVRVAATEAYVVRFQDGTPDEELGKTAAQFLRLIDGHRTVGDIIDAIADEMPMTEAMVAGKESMAALHRLYVEGVIDELRLE